VRGRRARREIAPGVFLIPVPQRGSTSRVKPSGCTGRTSTPVTRAARLPA
jgi:hypothetical protein